MIAWNWNQRGNDSGDRTRGIAMIEFNCSGCQTALRLPDDMGGLHGQCIKCGEILSIPTATEHYWPPGVMEAKAASRSSVRVAPPGKSSAPPHNPLSDTICYSVSDTTVVATMNSAASRSASSTSAAHRSHRATRACWTATARSGQANRVSLAQVAHAPSGGSRQLKRPKWQQLHWPGCAGRQLGRVEPRCCPNGQGQQRR